MRIRFRGCTFITGKACDGRNSPTATGDVARLVTARLLNGPVQPSILVTLLSRRAWYWVATVLVEVLAAIKPPRPQRVLAPTGSVVARIHHRRMNCRSAGLAELVGLHARTNHSTESGDWFVSVHQPEQNWLGKHPEQCACIGTRCKGLSVTGEPWTGANAFLHQPAGICDCSHGPWRSGPQVPNITVAVAVAQIP